MEIPNNKDILSVSVNNIPLKISPKVDSNIVPENIRKDVSILGVTGTMEAAPTESVMKTFLRERNGQFLYSNFTGSEITFLKNITNDDWSVVTTMENMFDTCQNLQTINLSNFNTSNVVNMQNMFHNCQNLQTIDLSSFNTSHVINMGYMFAYCNNLQTVNLSNFDTLNTVDIGGMFNNCYNLQTVNLSNFNTPNVTNMAYMFSYCSNLQTINLSSFNTTNVTDMKSMFEGCSTLQTIDLSNFNTINVTDMGNMFAYCNNLQTLTLSESGICKSYGAIFQDCNNLTSIMYNGHKAKWVGMDTNKNMFDCNLTQTITVTCDDGTLTYENGQLIVPQLPNPVTIHFNTLGYGDIPDKVVSGDIFVYELTEKPSLAPTGQVFVNWCYNQELSQDVTIPFEVSSEITLYAKYDVPNGKSKELAISTDLNQEYSVIIDNSYPKIEESNSFGWPVTPGCWYKFKNETQNNYINFNSLVDENIIVCCIKPSGNEFQNPTFNGAMVQLNIAQGEEALIAVSPWDYNSGTTIKFKLTE